MKYIQKIAFSKRNVLPAGVLLTSIFMNHEVSANIAKSYFMQRHNTSIRPVSFIPDKQYLPEEYPTPKLYYASFPEYTSTSFVIDAKSVNPLFLSSSTNYCTLSGEGKPGGVETTTSIDLNDRDGVQAFKASVSGAITGTDSSPKLITVKETTITGNNTHAITLSGNANNTIMLNYSQTGTKKDTTAEFTNPNDSNAKYTLAVYSGTGGGIEAGDGDNVVWIGGEPKEGFAWSGQGSGFNGPSHVYGDIKLGNGNNELKIYARSEVHGNLILGNGNNSLLIDNASIGLIVKNPYTYEFTTVPRLQANGNITLGAGKNTVQMDRVEMAGTLKSGAGEDSIRLYASSIYGGVTLEGAGKHSLELEHTTVYEGLELSGNNNSIVVKGGFIGKQKPYNNDTAKDEYKNIKMGDTGNTLSLYYLTFGGEIEGKGTIAMHAGATWKGDRTIKSGQNLFLFSSTQIEGNVSLENDSVSLHLYGGAINGDIGAVGKKTGTILVRYEESKDFVSTNASLLHGNVYAKSLDIGKGAGVYLEPLNVDKNDTSNPNHTITWDKPIQRILDVDSITLGGDVVLHGQVVGDVLTVKGGIYAQGGSFVLDMNFEHGTYDILDLTGANIHNTGGGANSIVYFVPEKPLYYGSVGTVLEGVVRGDSSLNIALKYSDVGGYEYELVRNPNQQQWDLRLVRISASNYAYAGILENMRNYTRHLWSTVNNTYMQERIAKHAGAFSILPNTSTNKRVFKNVGLTAWANVNYITNSIYDPSAPTIDEESLVATAGISADDITIDDENDITLSAFVGYGDSQSKLKQYERIHKMGMNALSFGILGTWNYTGISEKHTLFTTVGTWVDMMYNKVNLEGLDSKTNWETYSVKGLASFGYQLQEGSVIFLTSLDSIYSFTKGSSFITRSKNAIDIADDHQIAMRINALVGYSFNFGLTPFFQFAMDIPIYASNDGVIRSNGYAFRYESENFTTSFNIGLNYTMQFGEDSLRAYCILGIHKGQPSSIVEVGFTASGGISYTF